MLIHTLKLSGLLVVAGLFSQEDPVAAEALKGYTHPWAGFGEGSRVVCRENSRVPDSDASGKLIYRDVVKEIVWTVLEVAGQKSTIKIEGAGQKSIVPYFVALPGWTRGKGERKGEEEIAVGDRKFACQVTAILLDPGKDAAQVTTIWSSPAVPYWAVRRRVETFIKGKLNTSEEESLLDVEERVKVGDREVMCVVVQVTTDVVGVGRTVRKEWRSDEVPGRVVRRQSRQYADGKEVESGVSQMEVVSFLAKR
jgi:hypothetical protein